MSDKVRQKFLWSKVLNLQERLFYMSELQMKKISKWKIVSYTHIPHTQKKKEEKDKTFLSG